MRKGKRFPFVKRTNSANLANTIPYLPIALTCGDTTIEAMALLDTGASVNVLPYEAGLRLGATWSEQNVPIQLGGNLAREEARGIVLSTTIDDFPSVSLAFAWTRSKQVPVILGHTNFFEEFDVCFYRADSAFEICPKE
ncbi:MAG: aspartyl protease family protein [Cyanobacteria bacterium J06555_13]